MRLKVCSFQNFARHLNIKCTKVHFFKLFQQRDHQKFCHFPFKIMHGSTLDFLVRISVIVSIFISSKIYFSHQCIQNSHLGNFAISNFSSNIKIEVQHHSCELSQVPAVISELSVCKCLKVYSMHNLIFSGAIT